MDGFYIALFMLISALCAFVELRKGKPSGGGAAVISSNAFKAFRNNYLVVYSLMMAGDWLQGPYVYALYQYYGYDRGAIGKLFIAGFGSSLVFGTLAGTLVDKHGRKAGGLAYVLTYTASCVTKHWSNYSVLMLGRLLGGVATSLLFSTFEAWLVAEHFKRGYEESWLSGTFSKAIFLGNGLVAIASGLVGNFLVDSFAEGKVAPFDAAICVMLVGGGIVLLTWTENYGDTSQRKSSIADQFRGAMATISRDPKVAYLGAIQPLFEASMYTFVFMWTPAISPNDEPIPHGVIFAVFMLACMTGSSITGKLLESKVPPELFMQPVFAIGAAALFVPVIISYLAPGSSAADASGHLTFLGKVQIVAFLFFEAAVGAFWPSIMKMRSVYVPEESRATIINIFRMPLNLFVCIVLYNVSLFPVSTYLGMCSGFLALAAFCQAKLYALVQREGGLPSYTKL